MIQLVIPALKYKDFRVFFIKQLVTSIRRYEKETHPEYFNQNKISIISNWEKRPEPNPTVDYYKYKNPNGTFYKQPSKNDPNKGLEL